ncbi:hypothetical protein ACVW0P_004198 [Mucilaginibacter sp. UYNi724]
MLLSNPIYDPLGIELFAIDETFESVFNGLKGAYFRLFYKESIRTDGERDANIERAYYKRFKEISRLKRSYRYNDWISKKEAVETYGPELRQMIEIELTQFKPFV